MASTNMHFYVTGDRIRPDAPAVLLTLTVDRRRNDGRASASTDATAVSGLATPTLLAHCAISYKWRARKSSQNE